MKKYLTGVGVVLIMAGVWAVQAQKPQERKKIVYKGKTYLQDAQYAHNSRISKKAFDSLLAYGLVVRDSLNREYQAARYTFTYAERGVFEDSTGKLRIMTDYYSTESFAGKLPPEWLQPIRDRSKAGDTAFFFEVIYYQPGDTTRKQYHSEPLKLILTD